VAEHNLSEYLRVQKPSQMQKLQSGILTELSKCKVKHKISMMDLGTKIGTRNLLKEFHRNRVPASKAHPFAIFVRFPALCLCKCTKKQCSKHHPVKTMKTHSLQCSFVKSEEVASHCAGAQCGSTYQNTGIMMMKEEMT
jgi:hypothetical protein